MVLPYFSSLSHKRLDFLKKKKKLLNIKRVFFIFSATFVRNTSHAKKKWASYSHKCTEVFTYSTRFFLTDFDETWIFSTDFRKIFKYKTSLKSVRGSRVVPCGRTDRHDEANSRFSQLLKRA